MVTGWGELVGGEGSVACGSCFMRSKLKGKSGLEHCYMEVIYWYTCNGISSANW